MNRHEFLRSLHRVYRPRNYLEIGVNDGKSLALSRVPTVAVDPAFKLTRPVRCDLHLVKATSDDFFARRNPLAHLARGPLRRGALARRPRVRAVLERGPFAQGRVDFAFVDGMHQFEFVLRDFINVEKYATWSSLILLDDMLPRSSDEASRDRHSRMWAGDVYKLIGVLQEYRPDLVVLPVDSTPTGTLAVFGADPANSVLRDRYEEIVAEYAHEDPQKVPEHILDRRDAADPEQLVSAAFWPALTRARDAGLARKAGWPALRSRLERFRDGTGPA